VICPRNTVNNAQAWSFLAAKETSLMTYAVTAMTATGEVDVRSTSVAAIRLALADARARRDLGQPQPGWQDHQRKQRT
jgi:hypothetical protein